MKIIIFYYILILKRIYFYYYNAHDDISIHLNNENVTE